MIFSEVYIGHFEIYLAYINLLIRKIICSKSDFKHVLSDLYNAQFSGKSDYVNVNFRLGYDVERLYDQDVLLLELTQSIFKINLIQFLRYPISS